MEVAPAPTLPLSGEQLPGRSAREQRDLARPPGDCDRAEEAAADYRPPHLGDLNRKDSVSEEAHSAHRRDSPPDARGAVRPDGAALVPVGAPLYPPGSPPDPAGAGGAP